MTEGEARRNMKKMGCSLWKASGQIQLVVDGKRMKKAAMERPVSTRLYSAASSWKRVKP